MPFMVFAQGINRGADAKSIKETSKGVKRALVVGISNYQAASLKLNYADNDATIFKDYLRDVENIPEERLVYLIADESAPTSTEHEPTSSNILNELTRLMDETQEGDTVYFYFAGHGDVVVNYENRDVGFLLASDANENRNYFGTSGVIALKHLDSVISVVTNKGAKFVLTLDACHSGFLYKEGTQKNLETFNNNFQHSTKFFSCKPTEYSLESKDIGHGYFTYYLVLGLLGAADNLVQDNNLQYYELSAFLADNVYNETDKKQSPIVWTQYFNEVFTPVNTTYKEAALNTLKSSSGIKDVFSARGFEQTIYEKESKIPIVKQFNTALKSENYFGTNLSAYELYNKAVSEQIVKISVTNRMRNSLVNALSTNAQILINLYIGNAEILPNSEEFITKATYLEVCLELLDKDAFNYDRLYMSKLFLEAYSIIRARQYSKYPEAKEKLVEALKIENRAAYIHNALGIVLNHENNYKEADFHYKKAIALIPSWSFPVNNLGVNYYEQYQYKEAKKYYYEALKLKGSYGNVLNNLGAISQNQGKYLEAEYYFHRVKEIEGDYSVTTMRNLGSLYENKGNIKKAIEWYQRAFEKDSTDVYILYDYSEILNDYNLDSKKPEEFLKKAIALEPFFSRGYAEYADFLRRYPKDENSLKEADSLYNFAISNDPFYTWSYAGRGWLYDKLDDKDKALQSFEEGIKINSNKAKPYHNLATYYRSGLSNDIKAEEYYFKAIKKDSFYMPSYKSLISLYNSNDEEQKSLELINNVLSWNNEAPDIYNLLGNTYFELGDFKAASKAYEQSIAIDSTYAKGYSNLAYGLLQNEHYKKAAETYKKAYHYNPYKNNLESFSKLMLAKARKKNRNQEYETAELILKSAKDLVTTNETIFALGEYYYLKNQTLAAQELINELVQLELSKTWQIKTLDLAIKIEIDLSNKTQAIAYLSILKEINPSPNLVLDALVLEIDGKNREAKELIKKVNPLLLDEKFLSKKFSSQSIQLINTLK